MVKRFGQGEVTAEEVATQVMNWAHDSAQREKEKSDSLEDVGFDELEEKVQSAGNITKTTEYTDLICSLCSKPIPVDFMEDGSTWDGGHTTWPVLGVDPNDKANGRCCLQCNTTEVMPARLMEMLIKSAGITSVTGSVESYLNGLATKIEREVESETARQFSYGNTWPED